MSSIREFILSIAVVSLLVSCGEAPGVSESPSSVEDEEVTAGPSCPVKDASWTMMFYIVADDGGVDLDRSTVRSINTLPELANNVEVLVLLDRCPNPITAVNSGSGPIRDGCAQLYTIRQDGVPELLDMAPHKLDWLVERDGDVSMGDPTTLRGFVRFGMEYTNSTNYGLIISGHGDGNQVGFDSTNDSALNPSELAFAIGEALDELDDPCHAKLDVVVMGACAMATAGTYIALAPYADWLIASQENIYGYGLEWVGELGRLGASDPVSMAEVAEELEVSRIEGLEGVGQQVTLELTEARAEKISELVVGVGQILRDEDVPRIELEELGFNQRGYDLKLVTEFVGDAMLLEELEAVLSETVFMKTELSSGNSSRLVGHGISATSSDLGMPGSLIH